MWEISRKSLWWWEGEPNLTPMPTSGPAWDPLRPFHPRSSYVRELVVEVNLFAEYLYFTIWTILRFWVRDSCLDTVEFSRLSQVHTSGLSRSKFQRKFIEFRRVSVSGAGYDNVEYKTVTERENGFNPAWHETFRWNLEIIIFWIFVIWTYKLDIYKKVFFRKNFGLFE